MPYESAKQSRYMHAKHPAIAKRWDAKYGKPPHGSAQFTEADFVRGYAKKKVREEPVDWYTVEKPGKPPLKRKVYEA